VSRVDGHPSLTEAATAPGGREGGSGTVRVEQIMGTAISLDLRDRAVSPAAVDAMFDHLSDVDARFSTYREDSEISRLGRGEMSLDSCSPDVREVLERCEALRELSRGYFDIRAHRSDGGLDPSGFVKGWAAEGAAGILNAGGARNYCLNAGGDVITRGEPEPGRSWRVGIRHPELPDKLATVLETRDLAVATSGAYERGEHIVDPHTGREPDGLLSFFFGEVLPDVLRQHRRDGVGPKEPLPVSGLDQVEKVLLRRDPTGPATVRRADDDLRVGGGLQHSLQSGRAEARTRRLAGR